jgi:hypothetical protein
MSDKAYTFGKDTTDAINYIAKYNKVSFEEALAMSVACKLELTKLEQEGAKDFTFRIGGDYYVLNLKKGL